VRAQNSGKLACATGLLILLCALGSGSADVGGGKGYPATPWRLSAPKSVEDLEKAKSVAAEYQTLSLPREPGSKDLVHLRLVSLRPEKPREGDKPGYTLVGKSESGKTVSLSFSQIESFIVTAKRPKAIVLSVTVWPDISSKDLFEKQPTYKQLVEGYRRTVVLEVNLRSADGRPLGFAAKSVFEAALPLETLSVGTKGDFYGDPHIVHPLQFWWAIPSVAKDPDYPYRLIPAA
jgi:hypothetical protein